MSIYFSDIDEGATYRSGGRTVTEADISNFAGISGDYNPLHTDELWVRKNTDFHGRIAHGLLVLAITESLRTPGIDDWSIRAFLNVERSFAGPVYPGDTLRTEWCVESLRASRSRPGSGIVTVHVTAKNQRDEVVQEGRDTYLVGSKEETE